MLAAMGCDAPKARFRFNEMYLVRQAGTEDLSKEQRTQATDVATVLQALFGTPDQPFIVEDEGIGMAEVIDDSLLAMAAGPVGRDENGFPRGLYRQHCAHCHGVTGDGLGPTAEFLNPYPRDFRLGKFKFKSTPIGEKPTDEDLRKTLVNGIPGTAMPSFKLLASDEVEALLNYVKYLSLRGETERRLIETMTQELAPEDKLETTREFLVEDVLAGIVEKWARANESVTAISARPDWRGSQLEHSIALGRDLFNSKQANCFGCHGVTAIGDGQQSDYDDWSKDFADWGKIANPKELAQKLAQFHDLGGLGPRNAIPRNLRQGVYRGGRRPVDLFWRIRNGIEGTPMPAQVFKAPDAAANVTGLTDDDIWHLVDYVQSLPYESLSLPPPNEIENLRLNP
jgi:mono/diheme cytochrome c family protein